MDAGAFIDVPAFFAYPGAGTPNPEYSEAYSLLPNLVNLVVVNARLVVAEPFYEGFKTELISRLSAIGYQDGSSLRFIDDWDVYHEKDGEIHCGTYTKRTSSRLGEIGNRGIGGHNTYFACLQRVGALAAVHVISDRGPVVEVSSLEWRLKAYEDNADLSPCPNNGGM